MHQGEMVMAGADVLGDGVNVASRLQEASHEGCITISGKVNSDIRNKAGINAKYIGEKKLKNVDDPIKVYEVLCEEEESKHVEGEEVKSKIKTLYYLIAGIIIILGGVIIWQFLPTKETSPPIPVEIDKSIAVLPFRNDSPDQANEYFCNGTVEAIFGTSHIISLDEAKHVYGKGAKLLIIGAGQYSRVNLSDEAENFFKQKKCKVKLQSTSKAIKTWNKTNEQKTIGLFHVTC